MFNPVHFYESGKLDRLICNHDTYIDGGFQSTNFNNSIFLIVKTNVVADARRSFVEFKSSDFSKYSKLRVHQIVNATATNIISIAIDLMPNIDFSTLTYLNEPSADILNIATFNCLPITGWIEIDLQSFLSTYTQSTLTLRFRAPIVNNRAVAFSARGNSDNRSVHLIK